MVGDFDRLADPEGRIARQRAQERWKIVATRVLDNQAGYGNARALPDT